MLSHGGSAISVAPSDIDGGTDANRRQFRWVQRGFSFSGRERNCCFLNTGRPADEDLPSNVIREPNALASGVWRDSPVTTAPDASAFGSGKFSSAGRPGTQKFADVSAVSGFDFPDDARAIGRVDWDLDGDNDLWIANRNGPQLRFLRNDQPTDNHHIAFRLEGRTCNRDAIGARVEITVQGTSTFTLVKTLQAGDGYLSQSSKWIHFGLGRANSVSRIVVRWPGGQMEEFSAVPVNERYRLIQGRGRVEPLTATQSRVVNLQASALTAPVSTDKSRVFLSAPIPLPRLSYQTFRGEPVDLDLSGGRPLLINFWATWCQPCLTELAQLTQNREQLDQAVDVLVLSVDHLQQHPTSDTVPQDILQRLQFPFSTGQANADLVDKLQLAHDLIFDVRVPMPIPTSILINGIGEFAAIYRGPVDIDQLLTDISRAARKDAAKNIGNQPTVTRSVSEQNVNEADLADTSGYIDPADRLETSTGDATSLRVASLPFAGRWHVQNRVARLLPLAWDLIQHGHLDDGLDYVIRIRPHLSRDPEYAKLLARAGYELLEHGDVERAAEQYRAALEVNPRTTVAHLNLAFALMKLDRHADALEQYRKALRFSPDDPRLHYSLAWLLATAPDPTVRDGAEAVRWAEKAATASRFQHAPALEALAAAYAESGRFNEAVTTAQKALQRARQAKDTQAFERIQNRLRLYGNGQPYHE